MADDFSVIVSPCPIAGHVLGPGCRNEKRRSCSRAVRRRWSWWSAEAECHPLLVPCDRKLRDPQQRSTGQFDRLAAFKDLDDDIRGKKPKSSQPGEMAACDRIIVTGF
ncbi:MAG: hypothetical protein ABW128_10305 [Rhizorhabdus sp.]